MDTYWKLRTRCWRSRILILLSLTILGLIAPDGSAGVNRPEKLLHSYGCRFTGINNLTGIESLTADGHGNFTSGTLFFTIIGPNNSVLACRYTLFIGTYFVNLDNTGSTQMTWTLTNDSSTDCPKTSTSDTTLTVTNVIVLENAEKHFVAEQFDWVQSDLPIGGVCTQQ